MAVDPNDGGPTMLAATALLRPGPARIGSLGKNVTLPRTVRVSALLGALVGGFFGVMLGGVLAGVLHDSRFLLYAAGIGGMAGYAAVSYSPLQGESLATWLALTAKASRNRVLVAGTPRKVIVLPVDEPAPDDAVLVAAAGEYVAYATATPPQGAQTARVSIGICPLDTLVAGPVRLMRGFVDVPAGSVNARGVPR